MGDLAADTDVTRAADGLWRARLSEDWNVWGPNGGYVASVCLRAAGAATDLARPATIACHYLTVGRFADVELRVEVLRATKRTAAIRVHMTQDDVPLAEATVWAVAPGLDGHTWSDAVAPQVSLPGEAEPGQGSGHAMGRNFQQRRPTDASGENPAPGVHESRTWMRYVPTPTFADPWVDACRSLILVDTWAWPAAVGGMSEEELARFAAPNLDVTARFHTDASSSEWLLADARAPIAEDGLIGTEVAVWTEDGRLAASGGAQLFCRPWPSS